MSALINNTTEISTYVEYDNISLIGNSYEINYAQGVEDEPAAIGDAIIGSTFIVA